MLADLRMMDEAMEKCRPSPRLFRPPYGVTNPNPEKSSWKWWLYSRGLECKIAGYGDKDEHKLLERSKPVLNLVQFFYFTIPAKATLADAARIYKKLK